MVTLLIECDYVSLKRIYVSHFREALGARVPLVQREPEQRSDLENKKLTTKLKIGIRIDRQAAPPIKNICVETVMTKIFKT